MEKHEIWPQRTFLKIQNTKYKNTKHKPVHKRRQKERRKWKILGFILLFFLPSSKSSKFQEKKRRRGLWVWHNNHINSNTFCLFCCFTKDVRFVHCRCRSLLLNIFLWWYCVVYGVWCIVYNFYFLHFTHIIMVSGYLRILLFDQRATSNFGLEPFHLPFSIEKYRVLESSFFIHNSQSS